MVLQKSDIITSKFADLVGREMCKDGPKNGFPACNCSQWSCKIHRFAARNIGWASEGRGSFPAASMSGQAKMEDSKRFNALIVPHRSLYDSFHMWKYLREQGCMMYVKLHDVVGFSDINS